MREKLLIFVGIALVLLALYLNSFPLSITNTVTEYHDIQGGRVLEVVMHFESGEKEEGYFTVRHEGVGSWDEEVKFQIKDPYGTIISDAGIVKARHDFAFVAENSGEYSFYFDNGDSTVNKRIFLLVRVVGSIHLDLNIIFAAGVSIAALGTYDRYRKMQKRKLGKDICPV